LDYHLEVGQRLASLRDRGIMVIASGNVVHNLRRLEWNRPDAAFDWAVRFDDAASEVVAEAPGDVLKLREHADYKLAVPTPDHFIPLLYLAGIAANDAQPMMPLVRGYSMGSISMSCYGIDAAIDCADAEGAATLPSEVPADQSNI
jgi:4,5-DOPA dioxygenase extradiol